MNLLYKINNFDDILDFSIDIPFIKKERNLLKTILSKNIDHNNLKDYIIKIDNTEDNLKTLKKLSNKMICYSLKLKTRELHGEFTLIPSIIEDEEYIYISLANEFFESFSKNSFFYYIKFNEMISFTQKETHKLYTYILKNKRFEGNVYFSLEEFKKLLGITKPYDRYYDFEKNIVVPIVNDLNIATNYMIKIDKVHQYTHSNSKIIGVDIKILNKSIYTQNDVDVLNKLVDSNSSIIDNSVYNLLLKYIKKFDYEYVYNNFMFSKKHYKGEFKEFLIQSLEHNLYKKYLDPVWNLIDHHSKENISLFEMQGVILNILENAFTKDELNIKDKITLQKKIYELPVKKNIVFEKNNKRLSINYENKVITISLFEK